MKRVLSLVLAMVTLLSLLLLCGCGEKKILHCDRCGIEVKVDVDSNMEEGWIIHCADCDRDLFGDDPLVEEGDLPDALKK